ncbi:MAG: translation elongation factor Ts [Puniceicoccales bacterium]|jgi:elongation factor Ts|nr:translation elongation factor Ts [Puniceicoccales bacterium]
MSANASAKLVGELRERTGAGLMDCKKALEECGSDIEKAVIVLKKKGIASADKKAQRQAAEGLVTSYIHTGGRIGVLLQLNCETDFVAKNDQFIALAHDICMHIAAFSPQYVCKEDVPAEVIAREKEIAESQVVGKPPNAVNAIVEGKLAKYCAGICLLEQPFVKNPDISVGDLIKEHIAKIGENIRVVRFTRFQVGA